MFPLSKTDRLHRNILAFLTPIERDIATGNLTDIVNVKQHHKIVEQIQKGDKKLDTFMCRCDYIRNEYMRREPLIYYGDIMKSTPSTRNIVNREGHYIMYNKNLRISSKLWRKQKLLDILEIRMGFRFPSNIKLEDLWRMYWKLE